MTAWPRRLINFPIILFAITQQLIVGLSLLADRESHFATSVHILHMTSQMMPHLALPLILMTGAAMAVSGFFARRKVNTLLLLIPQQLLLWLSAGGAFQAIWLGHFADGVQRSHAFILVDQCPTILIAIFHSWAMLLILRHGADRAE